eukprot:5387931-Pyramimonas_sp.AAC.1
MARGRRQARPPRTRDVALTMRQCLEPLSVRSVDKKVIRQWIFLCDMMMISWLWQTCKSAPRAGYFLLGRNSPRSENNPGH